MKYYSMRNWQLIKTLSTPVESRQYSYLFFLDLLGFIVFSLMGKKGGQTANNGLTNRFAA